MSKTAVKKAMSQGRRQARTTLEARAAALEERTEALSTMTIEALAPTPSASLQALSGGSRSAGVLVAEGDSWFDYPGTDVLSVLEDSFGYDVESVAHKGDRVEDMAYGAGQLDKFTRTLEKVIRRGMIPKAILLSGGGNDIAGDEFRVLLNHASSPVSGLDKRVLDGVINYRLFYSYLTIISAITEVCKKKAGRTLPILVHGYDYPVADGRGYWGGWWKLPGPWLEPGFREKGFADPVQMDKILTTMIDTFNKMLVRVAAEPALAHVTFIDLRGTLPKTPTEYKKWWDNELHPTKTGFQRVAARIAAAL